MPPIKRLYAPFTAMIMAHFNIFLAVHIPTVRKKILLLHILSICFVTKTKIIIGAESTNGFSPFFFSFQKFYRTVIINFEEII